MAAVLHDEGSNRLGPRPSLAAEKHFRRGGVGLVALLAFVAMIISLLVVPYGARWYFYVGLGMATVVVIGVMRFLSSDY